MHNPELPITTGVAALLILLPLPAKLRLRNIALLVLIANCFFINLFSCINALLWADHARDVAPIWCDFSMCLLFACPSCGALLMILRTATNFRFYCPLAVLGATVCICRHLEWVSSQGNTALGRRNSVWFEITLCVVAPLASIPIRASLSVFAVGLVSNGTLGYALSPFRYIILENFGCIPVTHLSTLSIGLTFGPPLVLCAVSSIYAGQSFASHKEKGFICPSAPH
jgi:pheromone a factor receptor